MNIQLSHPERIHAMLTAEVSDLSTEQVQVLIDEVTVSAADLGTEAKEAEAMASDFKNAPTDMAKASERALLLFRQQAMLNIGVDQLRELLQQVSVAERDADQQAEYVTLQGIRDGVEAELVACRPYLTRYADALAAAATYNLDIQKFNAPKTGEFVNPMDRLVSKYDYLPMVATDAEIKGSVIVAPDGNVLYANDKAQATVGTAPQMPAVAPDVPPVPELELLNQAKEAQIGAKATLDAMQRQAGMRNVSLEKIAENRGMTSARFKELQDTASGLEVQRAQRKFEEAIGAEQSPAKKEGPSGGH